MNKKIIMPIALIVLVGLISMVVATSWGIGQFESHTTGWEYTTNAYKITYDIKNPGWYLLPSQGSVVSLSEETGDFVAFYKSVDYKYAFSPFTKKYVLCEEKPNYNPLYCDIEKIYDVSEEDLSSFSDDVLGKQYTAYTMLSADWHYYSKPVKVVYAYFPFMLFDYVVGDDDIGLLATKLKKGWNLITFPAYLSTEEIELAECVIEKSYIFDDTNQEWVSIPVSRLDNDMSYAGGGFAIKVGEDCVFLKKKGTEGTTTPPTLPN